jgi:hypothetical protein
LTCSSLNGNPPPQYTWYRNDTLLTYDNDYSFFFEIFKLYSSSLNQQVSFTDNSSIYTFNVSRFDNQIKYECQISNQALTKPLRVEKYLHIKCKEIDQNHLRVIIYLSRSTLYQNYSGIIGFFK